MIPQVNVGDYGTEFLFAFFANGAPVDISDASLLQMTMRRPDGSQVVANLAPVTDGKDGLAYYVVAYGDLSETGQYQIQGVVQTPSGQWSTDIKKLNVLPNL